MRVTVDHAALQRAVATLAPVFGGTTITYGPIGSVRLDTHRRTLRLTAYGREAALMLTVPAQVEDPGEVILPGKLFGAVVEALEREPVALARTTEGLRMDCGASQFVLAVTTVEAPSLEAMPQDAVRLPAHALSSALERVSFAASTQQTYGPAALGGVLLEVGEGRLRAVATNGAQLALAERGLAGDAHVALRCIVPVRTAAVLARLLRTLAEDSEVQLATSEQAVFLQWDGGRVRARQLDGTFPDYQRVLAGEPDATTRIRASRAALLAALRRAGAVVSEQAKMVVLKQEADTLVVLAPRNEVGSATDRIPAVFAGSPVDIGVNTALLIRGLSTLAAGSDEVVMHLRGPTAPVIVEPAGDTADRYVLAPVRLAEPIPAA